MLDGRMAGYNFQRTPHIMGRKSTPGGRYNPLRELVSDQNRRAEAARTRERAEKLKADLPSIIEDQVGEHIQKLESKLLSDFKRMGQQAIDESTAIIGDQLSERIETLERISSIQSRTIVNLRDSSKIAEEKVSSVVNSIEKTLADAVPGFHLEASPHATPQIESHTEVIKAEPRDVEEFRGKYGFCPNCTSTNVRRAYRHGIWEEFLRLFFIAPFRCRACRHKFYRF
jgi:ribosomal protein L37AE/L43A